MDKKYQIFVSSTFADLQAERASVIKMILDMNHIPAGMEAFPAADEEQFKYIKDVIDNCDYYVLIVGGRYGSIDSKTGKSYTEMEYDYACEKGIPIIAFICSNESLIDDSPEGQSKKDMLRGFRGKISENRLVKFWADGREIPGLVATSLSLSTTRNPRQGWVRNPDVDLVEILNENRRLKSENENLRKLNNVTDIYDFSELGMDDKLDISIFGKHPERRGKELFELGLRVEKGELIKSAVFILIDSKTSADFDFEFSRAIREKNEKWLYRPIIAKVRAQNISEKGREEHLAEEIMRTYRPKESWLKIFKLSLIEYGLIQTTPGTTSQSSSILHLTPKGLQFAHKYFDRI